MLYIKTCLPQPIPLLYSNLLLLCSVAFTLTTICTTLFYCWSLLMRAVLRPDVLLSLSDTGHCILHRLLYIPDQWVARVLVFAPLLGS